MSRWAGRQAAGAQAHKARGSGPSCLLWVPLFSKFVLVFGGLMFPALVPIPPELELAKCRAAQPEALLNRGGRLTRVGGSCKVPAWVYIGSAVTPVVLEEVAPNQMVVTENTEGYPLKSGRGVGRRWGWRKVKVHRARKAGTFLHCFCSSFPSAWC